MAGNQTDNLMLLDLTTGLARTVQTGGTPDTIQLSIDVELISGANMTIDGDLYVKGTTTTIQSEIVNIGDNHLYLNDGYTTAVAQTGGLVINYLPTATSDTVAATGFVAGVASTSNPTVNTTSASTFVAGDLIQISGAANQTNDGLFEVDSHAGNVLTIRGVGTIGTTVGFVQNQFVTDTTVQGTITKVNVAVLQSGTDGSFEVTNTSTTTGISFTDITVQGVVDLQEAYEQGNTITTSATEGNVTIAGTETVVITASGGIDLDTAFDFDGTTFDVQMTGTNGFSIDGTAASNVTVDSGILTLSTTTSGDIDISSVAEVDIDAGTTVVIDTADATDASGNDITITAGSSTGGTNAGASIILTPGDGDTTGVAGSVDITGPNDEDEAIFTLETTGTNGDKIEMYVGDSSPSGSVTALAGSLFFRDTGTGAELYLNTSTGSGTTWTQLSTAAGATLQSAYEAGNTITTSSTEGDITFTGTEDFVISLSDLLVDTTASISLDADAASNFTVDGGILTLSTTTSGDIDISSVAEVDIDAGTTVVIDTADATDASGNDITITAGSSTGGTNAGASIILTPGDGDTTGAAGDVTILSPADEDEAILTLTSSGTSGDSVNLFVGDNSPSGSVTGLAGSLFFRDTGSGAELYLNTSTGSGTTWTQIATGGTVTLQNAYVGGNTITTSATEGDVTITGTEDLVVSLSDLLVDTTASISLDADAASNFTVDSANLTLSTTTSGTLDITSADDIQMTFETANSTAMVIDDGTNNYLTFDSTSGSQAVEVNQFLDIVGKGAGITLTAGEAISAAQVVTIEATTGDAILADSNTGTTIDGLAIGIAAESVADTNPVKVYTVPGSLVQVQMASAPAAADNGKPVFVSQTPGQATLTPPTGSGNVVYIVGILQGADGADTTPLIVYQPQFISVRP